MNTYEVIALLKIFTSKSDRGNNFKFFFKKLQKKDTWDFFRVDRYYIQLYFDNLKIFLSGDPLDQGQGQKFQGPPNMGALELFHTVNIYLESSFNYLKNESKIKFLCGIVFEI